MIFIDDINLAELAEQQKLELVLVDHHSLRSSLNDKVVEIIDHHRVNENSIALKEYDETRSTGSTHLLVCCSPSKITIEPVGSCCTLIAEKILSSSFEMSDELAHLLTGKRMASSRKRKNEREKNKPRDKLDALSRITLQGPFCSTR